MSRFERIKADMERKQKEATERQAAYDKLTIQQKIDLLDRAFGPGLGAAKQRKQFAARIAKDLEEQAKEEKRKAKRAEKE